MGKYNMSNEELLRRVEETMKAIEGLRKYIDTLPDGYGIIREKPEKTDRSEHPSSTSDEDKDG